MSASLIRRWGGSITDKPVISVVSRTGRAARVPFVGLVEAFVLRALRQAGVPANQVRPVVQRLQRDFGVAHALASERLYTDGAELAFDVLGVSRNPSAAPVMRAGLPRFRDVLHGQLFGISYGPDGRAQRLRLPAYETAEVIVDPRQAFGQPFVARGGARVEDLLDRFGAGESCDAIAEDFDVLPIEVEDVIRVALRWRT